MLHFVSAGRISMENEKTKEGRRERRSVFGDGENSKRKGKKWGTGEEKGG